LDDQCAEGISVNGFRSVRTAGAKIHGVLPRARWLTEAATDQCDKRRLRPSGCRKKYRKNFRMGRSGGESCGV